MIYKDIFFSCFWLPLQRQQRIIQNLYYKYGEIAKVGKCAGSQKNPESNRAKIFHLYKHQTVYRRRGTTLQFVLEWFIANGNLREDNLILTLKYWLVY